MKWVLLTLVFCTLASSSEAAIAFVQSTGVVTGVSAISTSTFFASNVTSGDMVWCATNWGDTTHTMVITDAAGDVYTSSGGFTSQATLGRSQIFYSTGVIGGFKKVTATINAGTINITLMCHEYSGVRTGNTPVDVAISSQSTANVTAPTSNSTTTTNSADLGVAGGFSSNSISAAQPGWTQRVKLNGHMTEDTIFTVALSTAAKFTSSSGIAAVGFEAFFPSGGSNPFLLSNKFVSTNGGKITTSGGTISIK